jgi:hypothetical protein
MQILHPFSGTVQQYLEQLADPDSFRPSACLHCEAKGTLRAHGFYRRSVVDVVFDGCIRVRRYLCCVCWRTVSLLPEFVLPYLRFSISVIARFLKARVVDGLTLLDASREALPGQVSCQEGHNWHRRFQSQAPALGAALAALTPSVTASSFERRAIHMLEKAGWIPAHRFLLSRLRAHLLGWPRFLTPQGRPVTL